MTTAKSMCAQILLHRYRGLSLRRVGLLRASILADYLRDRARFSREYRADMTRLRSMRNSRADAECLIIGGGPSSKNLSPDKVCRAQKAGVEVWAFNMYCDSELAQHVVPDMYLLSDPAFFVSPEQMRADVNRTWEFITHHEIPYIVPTGRSGYAGHPPAHVVNGLSLVGWSRNIDPTRPRGYSNMVAMSSLAVTLHLGYSRIFLSGFDNTIYRNIYRDRAGVIRYDSGTHHYPTTDLDIVGATAEGNIYLDGVPAIFEAVGRIFWEYRLFQSERVVNLDQVSLVDAFSPASDAEVERFWLET